MSLLCAERVDGEQGARILSRPGHETRSGYMGELSEDVG